MCKIHFPVLPCFSQYSLETVALFFLLFPFFSKACKILSILKQLFVMSQGALTTPPFEGLHPTQTFIPPSETSLHCLSCNRALERGRNTFFQQAVNTGLNRLIHLFRIGSPVWVARGFPTSPRLLSFVPNEPSSPSPQPPHSFYDSLGFSRGLNQEADI